MPSIEYICRDHIKITADESFTMNCKTLAAFIEEDMEVDLIPLPNMYSSDLQLIVDFFKTRAEYCQLLATAEEGEVLIHIDEQTRAWGENYFVNTPTGTLIDLLMAANYLNSEILIDAVAKSIAHRLRRKTRNEMREILQIENDFTPEEEERIIEETSWAYA